ncbi:MAG: VWA domain-containing protein [Acidobacteriota bacterium]
MGKRAPSVQVSRHGVRWGILPFIATFAVVPLQGQQPSSLADTESVFDEVVDVRVINLEAVVVDGKGNRVQGLSADDFVLLVDGREVPIGYFSEIENGALVQRPSTIEQPVPPGVTSEGTAGNNFLLYVDDNHTVKRERDLLVRNLIEDLGALGPNDSMAIVVASGTDLKVLSGWTQDRAALQTALQRLLDASDFCGTFCSPIRNVRRTSLRRTGPAFESGFAQPTVGVNAPRGGLPSLGEGRLLGNPADLPSLPSAQQIGFDDPVAQLIDLELALSGALSTLMGFDPPTGRKVMLLMSGEWPIGNFRRGTSTFSTLTELELMNPLIETANLRGYTLYPINENSAESIWRNSTFSRVAQRTGGRTLSRRTEILADAVSDTSSYYWLGFTPDLLGDDRGHRVKLKARPPGLKVRSRRGYVDLSREGRMAMDTQGALFFGRDSELGDLALVFGEPERLGLRRMKVPLTLRIPLDALQSVPVSGEEQIEIEVRFAVVNENGATADVPTVTRILRGENRKGDVYELDVELTMRRVPHALLAAIHDRASGRTLRVRGGIGPEGEIATLHPPNRIASGSGR